MRDYVDTKDLEVQRSKRYRGFKGF